jgi:hypothetical protein
MVNTLVIHKKLKSLGIGCIAKELKSSYKVNFGLDDVMTCKKDSVEVIDTSKCKTVTFIEYRNRILSDKSTLDYCIVGNELKHFVGIGWLTHRVVTLEDLKKYPRVVD